MHRDKSVEATPAIEHSVLPMLDEVLAEADRLRPSWRSTQLDLRLSGVPLNDEEDEEDEPLSKKEADKLKKAIAKKDREVRDKQKEVDDLNGRVETLEEKIEESAGGGGGGEEGGNKALEQRLEKMETRVEKAEAKAEAAEEKRETAEKRSTAIDVATRLNFRNPKRAINHLGPDDLEDEDSIESALEQLATEEPYMVSSKKQRQVEDKPKPKRERKKPESEEDKPKTGDDEPTGKARIKAAYDEAESEGEGEGGDEGESED